MAPPESLTISALPFVFLLFDLTWTTCRADLGFNKVIVPCNANSTFQCATDGKCILNKYKCDGVKHCADNSDEVGCWNEKCDEKLYFTCEYPSGRKFIPFKPILIRCVNRGIG